MMATRAARDLGERVAHLKQIMATMAVPADTSESSRMTQRLEGLKMLVASLAARGESQEAEIARWESKFEEFLAEVRFVGELTSETATSMAMELSLCNGPTTRLEPYRDPQQGIGEVKMDWPQRLKVALGVPRGLAYLHSGSVVGIAIVHRDFKSTKILLGENFEAKTGKLTIQSDVYAFEVVRLELLIGRRTVDLTQGKIEDHDMLLNLNSCLWNLRSSLRSAVLVIFVVAPLLRRRRPRTPRASTSSSSLIHRRPLPWSSSSRLLPGRPASRRSITLTPLHLTDASPLRLCISSTPHRPRASAPGWARSSSRRRVSLAPLLPGRRLRSLVGELPGRPLADTSPSRLCSLVGELPGHPLADASPSRLYSLVVLCSLVAQLCSLIVAP
ncbi:hypothetical protein Syun_008954 [Stephania yunnanensis]|uniref:Uncharacterized protein n=1 Tax=Stephania yunnanensis TaxID=152371 RepID=A0AAP0KG96_9MAGN